MNDPTAEKSHRFNGVPSLCPAVSPSLWLSVSLSLCLIALALPANAFAQRKQRPQLLTYSRNQHVGKILLVPRDDRFLELRTLAQIADHQLLLPPSHLLNPKPHPDKLLEWLKAQDLTGISGVILSLEALSADASSETSAQLSQTIKQLRSQNPRATVYGFTSLASSAESSKQVCQSAIELTANGALDLLLIGQDEDLSVKPAQIARARLIGEAATQKVEERIIFDDNAKTAATTLLARFLAQRLGRLPKILPVYSSAEARRSDPEHNSISLDQSLTAKIKLSGGTVLPPNPETAPQVDVLLFVHSPNTSEEQRSALVLNVLQTIDSGVRIAFVDASESAQTKDAMLAELRKHKLLGKLTSYASAPLEETADRATLNRALAHTVIFFSAIKSLRSDIDRVHRIERAQINWLFSRILEDWAYQRIVRPQLEEFARQQLKADPAELGDQVERVEKFVYDAMQAPASELFDEQFRRNAHAVLLNSGTRIQFRVSLLQRLQVRMSTRNTAEPELRQNIHTFFDGYLPGSRQ